MNEPPQLDVEVFFIPGGFHDGHRHSTRSAKSPNKNKRYDACEELRVASDLPLEAISALEAASNDPDPDVADAARLALLAHQQVETDSISMSEDSSHSA